MTDTRPRCPWCGTDPLYVAYHDDEWGVPLRDERALFELLCLEGQQAGLSWITVLRKRAHYRVCFDGFDPERVAAFDDARLERILQDAGVVRNRLKIYGIRRNAQAWLRLRDETGDVVTWLWDFVGGTPRVQRPASMGEIATTSMASDAMSKALKKAGFTFVGSTICYAFQQASGMVDDHLRGCWRA
jgi:DNA-3-methyladenine glycosylase I